MNPEETQSTNDALILLDPADLANKWGFGDGDMFDELIYDWARERGLTGDDEYDSGWPYVDSRMLLRAAVRRFVFPAIPKIIADHIEEIGTIHNPIRLPHWEDDPRADGWEEELNNIEPVRVKIEDLQTLADELFPWRPRHWVLIYNGLVAVNIMPGMFDPRADISAWLDELDASNEELQLIAELIGSSTADIPERLAEALSGFQGHPADTTYAERVALCKKVLHDTLHNAHTTAKRLLR
jgi:hypothetical protein